MTDIDAVAEAICAVDPDMQGVLWPGKSEPGKDKYRRMAQAAIDALGLTAEWGINYTDSLDRHPDFIESLDSTPSPRVREMVDLWTRRALVTRLVSPWVKDDA